MAGKIQNRQTRAVGPDGYVRIYGYKSFRHEHVMVAESALGRPLPPKAIVHHHDGCRSNNAHANLVICEDQTYHNLLHMRMRLLAQGCDPDMQHICGHCKEIKPLNSFGVDRSRPNGRYGNCKRCTSEMRATA